jgi:hypothetical protein
VGPPEREPRFTLEPLFQAQRESGRQLGSNARNCQFPSRRSYTQNRFLNLLESFFGKRMLPFAFVFTFAHGGADSLYRSGRR